MPKSFQHIRLWTDFYENCMKANIMNAKMSLLGYGEVL